MDDIKQKLALIDSQLAGGRNIPKELPNKAPLAFAALGLMAGIIIQYYAPITDWVWLIGIGAVITIVIWGLIRQKNFDAVLPAAYLTFFAFMCLGGIRLCSLYRQDVNNISNFVGENKTLATMRGTVVSEPYAARDDWQYAKLSHTDPSCGFYLKLTEVKAITGWEKVSGLVRVNVNGVLVDIKPGDCIEAYCQFNRFRPTSNPGQFDMREYMKSQNVYVAATIDSRDSIKILKQTGSGIWPRFIWRLQEIAGELLASNPLHRDTEGMLQALLLGYRTDIDADTFLAFQKTGLAHFISLSGMNFGLLFIIAWWMCKTAGLQRIACTIVCLIVIITFSLVVPPRGPCLRAAIVAGVFCISFLFRRHPNPFNSLSLAALILLLINPTDLFDAGWQLSFAAVLGILAFTSRIFQFIGGWLAVFGGSWLHGLLAMIINMIAVGLAANIGIGGILLYHFYSINLMCIIWTILLSPLVALITWIGYLKIIFAAVLPTIGVWLGVILTILCKMFIASVKFFHSLNISQILFGKVSMGIIVIYYLMIFFIIVIHFEKRWIKKVIIAIMILSIVTYLGVIKFQRTYRDDLRLTVLDVGHGQAAVVQMPGKGAVLFDCGSLYYKDIGRKIVAPFLDYEGITCLDAIVISHKDIDHLNGIPEIVNYLDVRKIYVGRPVLDEADSAAPVRLLNNYLGKKYLKMTAADEKMELESQAGVEFIWPTQEAVNDVQLSDNDKSEVSLIEFAGRRILICSDIEATAQRELMKTLPSLKADVVILPHHGSRRTADKDFLQRVGQRVLICSCSQTDFDRQKKNKLPENPTAYYTPLDGAVTVTISNAGNIKVTTFINR